MSEPPRLAFDENMQKSVTRALRRRGVDVITVQDAGRREDDDPDLLSWATGLGRVLVTHDHDFEQHHREEQAHAGVVLVHDVSPVGHVIEWLEMIAGAATAEELRGEIIYVPRNP